MSTENAASSWSHRRFGVTKKPTDDRLRRTTEPERRFAERGAANASDRWREHVRRGRD
jgi:hypothetical protein